MLTPQQRNRAETLLQQRWDTVGVEMMLPEEQDAIYLWEMNVEVNNGTFDAYLSNDSGAHLPRVIAALEQLGSTRMLDLLRRVLAIIPGGHCEDQDERDNRLDQLPDRENVIQALTDEYHDAIEDEAELGEAVFERVYRAYERVGLLT